MSKAKTTETGEKKEVAFAPGFLTSPLSPRDQVRLVGTKCRSCGSVLLGKRPTCENCASTSVEELVLSNRGRVYTYTVMRYPPPTPYQAAEPYLPIPVAWVELPEGVMIVSHLKDCNPEEVHIGMEVELVVENGWQDADGNDVLMYKFRPIKKGGKG